MQAILSLNLGSSSIKFGVYTVQNGMPEKTCGGLIDSVTTNAHLKIKSNAGEILADKILPKAEDPYAAAILYVLAWLKKHDFSIIAAGHRIIHGGTRYRTATVLNPEIMIFLETFNKLAPLHQPYNLNGVKILARAFPDLFQVACFDTAFHTTCEPLTQLFALPQKYTDAGVLRYGFHGLSYEYIALQLPYYLTPDKVNGRIIIAHLGQGASMCAINNRQSVATTLGFSALDGLPMGTRCGCIDPGVILYLLSHYKMNYTELEHVLFKESGLLGVSGISHDMRILLASEDAAAKRAIDLFIYRINGWIGMLMAELGGIDAIIFTAGIGENSAIIREKICAKINWLGAKIDVIKNSENAANIAAQDSKIAIHVIPTDEEKIIALHTLRLHNSI